VSGLLESLTDQLTITEYRDWLVFVERLNDTVASGRVRQVPVAKCVYLRSEEWFLDPATNEIYVYVAPDAPILPKWERVDVLRYLEEKPDPAPLSGFPVGQITVLMAHVMKLKLKTLVGRGLVEELPPPAHAASSKDTTERWFRDNASNVIYRLTEHYGLKDADDLRWEVVPSAEHGGKIQ
jgi:hypothetical protein